MVQQADLTTVHKATISNVYTMPISLAARLKTNEPQPSVPKERRLSTKRRYMSAVVLV